VKSPLARRSIVLNLGPLQQHSLLCFESTTGFKIEAKMEVFFFSKTFFKKFAQKQFFFSSSSLYKSFHRRDFSHGRQFESWRVELLLLRAVRPVEGPLLPGDGDQGPEADENDENKADGSRADDHRRQSRL
jgi:hypothetical protein